MSKYKLPHKTIIEQYDYMNLVEELTYYMWERFLEENADHREEYVVYDQIMEIHLLLREKMCLQVLKKILKESLRQDCNLNTIELKQSGEVKNLYWSCRSNEIINN